MPARHRHRSGPTDVPHSASGRDRRRRRRCHLPVCGGGERCCLFVRDITAVEGSRMSVGTGSQVAGVSMVTIGGDRTQLILSGVQREVDEATVVCIAFGSTDDVDSNPATIAVQFTYLYTIVSHYHCNFSLLLFTTNMQTLLRNQPTTVLEGEYFTCALGLKLNQLPPTSPSPDGQVSPVVVG